MPNDIDGRQYRQNNHQGTFQEEPHIVSQPDRRHQMLTYHHIGHEYQNIGSQDAVVGVQDSEAHLEKDIHDRYGQHENRASVYVYMFIWRL